MKNHYLRICALIIVLSFFILALSSCSFFNEEDLNGIIDENESYEKADSLTYYIVDDDSLYLEEYDDEVTVLYLAVGLTKSGGEVYDWSTLNSIPLDVQGNNPYSCEALVQFGNEQSPEEGMFGYGEVLANATVRLQGQKASTRQQKNYRIDLKKGKGKYYGMKSFVLSKSFTDPFRVTQRFCNEFMELIPDMFSLRSQLVHLYVKDVTEENSKYIDYGLYTLYEPVNKTYFKQRQLDDDGEMYKVENFDFGRHEDIIRLNTDPGYNSEAFETLLEDKGSGDHSTLIEMLEAVNNYDIPIADTVKKYFDKDNIYTYLAFQILTGEYEKDTGDYFLYNPKGTDKFYFISTSDDSALRGDYMAMRKPGSIPKWEKGVSAFCQNVLFSRMFLSDSCVSNLSEAIDKLYEQYLSPDKSGELMSTLSELCKELIYSLPDKMYARVTSAQYDELTEKIPELIESNYYAYYDTLNYSQPFHIKEPTVAADGRIRLMWDESLSNNPVTYKVMVDESWTFETPVFSENGINGTQVLISALTPGQYFVSVEAVTDGERSMSAYETYSNEHKETVYGTLCFYVMRDGTVKASWFNGEE